VFIARENVGAAMDGDRVRIVSWNAPRGPEGRIEAVVARGRTAITGTIRPRGARFQFVPDDPRLVRIVNVSGRFRRKPWDKASLPALCSIPKDSASRWGWKSPASWGRRDSSPLKSKKTLAMAGIQDAFPAAVEEQVLGVPASVRENEMRGRHDLRAMNFITIDPKDAGISTTLFA
jgi:ribonuclease R